MEAGLYENTVHNRIRVFCITEGAQGNTGTLSRSNAPALQLLAVTDKNLNQLILCILTYNSAGKYVLTQRQRLFGTVENILFSIT